MMYCSPSLHSTQSVLLLRGTSPGGHSPQAVQPISLKKIIAHEQLIHSNYENIHKYTVSLTKSHRCTDLIMI